MVTKPEIRDRRAEYAFHDDIVYLHESGRGLTRKTVEDISALKGEPDWMLQFRLRAYDHFLKRPMPTWTEGLDRIDGVHQYGTRDLDKRVPTVTFTVEGRTPAAVAAALGAQGIFVWDGNYYALELMERLGLEPEGVVRIGLTHYNTSGEIDRLLDELRAITG